MLSSEATYDNRFQSHQRWVGSIKGAVSESGESFIKPIVFVFVVVVILLFWLQTSGMGVRCTNPVIIAIFPK